MARETRTGATAAAERTEADGRFTRDRAAPTAGDVRARQREEFGGMQWGSAFFGWLVAVGIAVLLVAIISAAGAAIGITSSGSAGQAKSNAGTVGIVGGILLLIVLMIAYYCGGYVAGRMARFDGPRQGLAVWLIGLAVTIILAVAGAVLGAEYNVLQQLNLPRIPVSEGSLTTGGVIALIAILVGTVLAAIAGGKAGTHFHRKVDRVGLG